MALTRDPRPPSDEEPEPSASTWASAESPLAGFDRPVDPPPGPAAIDRLRAAKAPARVALVSLYVIENSGVRLLAALLRGHGVSVHEVYFKDWLNNRVGPPEAHETARLIEELRRVKPDLVGLSVRASAFHDLAADLTGRIRQALGVPILWGGMHVTSCPEVAARVADLLVVGEAEVALPELFRRLRDGQPLEGIGGLWLHTARGVHRNPPAPLVQNLDALPFPDYTHPDKVFIDGRRVTRQDPYAGEPIYLLMASRGCPFPSCTFCSNSVMDQVYAGQKYFRLRSVDHVIREAQVARRAFKNLRRVRFDDEEFPVTASWLHEFCRRWPVEVGVPFEVHMDPRVVTEARLSLLKTAGLDTVFMGIQSTAKVNRALYGRQVTDEQVLCAARTLHASGLHVGYQVILDDPVSTSEDKRRLFELLLELPRPYELILFSLLIYPGSAIARDLLAQGLIGPEDIEGPAKKAFRQFRVDLAYPRPAEDRFYAALAVLVSKDFVPRPLLRRLADSPTLLRRPGPLLAAAYAANLIKLGTMGLDLLLRGELSWAVARRWLSLKGLVTY